MVVQDEMLDDDPGGLDAYGGQSADLCWQRDQLVAFHGETVWPWRDSCMARRGRVWR